MASPAGGGVRGRGDPGAGWVRDAGVGACIAWCKCVCVHVQDEGRGGENVLRTLRAQKEQEGKGKGPWWAAGGSRKGSPGLVGLVEQGVEGVAAHQRVERPGQVAHRLGVVLLRLGLGVGGPAAHTVYYNTLHVLHADGGTDGRAGRHVGGQEGRAGGWVGRCGEWGRAGAAGSAGLLDCSRPLSPGRR